MYITFTAIFKENRNGDTQFCKSHLFKLDEAMKVMNSRNSNARSHICNTTKL